MTISSLCAVFMLGACTDRSAGVQSDKPGTLQSVFSERYEKPVSRLAEYSYSEEQQQLIKQLKEKCSAADVLVTQHQFERAKKLCLETLAEDEPKFPPDDPQNCHMINRLVACTRELHQPQEEEKFARRLLALREKWLGPVATDTVSAVACVAAALISQGKYAEAQQLVDKRLSMVASARDTEYSDEQERLRSDPNAADYAKLREVMLLYQKARIEDKLGHTDKALSNLSQAEKLHTGLHSAYAQVSPTGGELAQLRTTISSGAADKTDNRRRADSE